MVVRSATSGDVLYSRDGSTRLVPASNQKLPTAMAAFALLGPEYRFRTRLHVEAPPPAGGVLMGNVYLKYEVRQEQRGL